MTVTTPPVIRIFEAVSLVFPRNATMPPGATAAIPPCLLLSPPLAALPLAKAVLAQRRRCRPGCSPSAPDCGMGRRRPAELEGESPRRGQQGAAGAGGIGAPSSFHLYTTSRVATRLSAPRPAGANGRILRQMTHDKIRSAAHARRRQSSLSSAVISTCHTCATTSAPLILRLLEQLRPTSAGEGQGWKP